MRMTPLATSFAAPARRQTTTSTPGSSTRPQPGRLLPPGSLLRPRIGRFLTTDPLAGSPANPKSLQRYAYAANDPVNGWDPSGRLDEIDIQVAAVGEGEVAAA